MRLRQSVIAASDLDGTVEALTAVLGIEVSFHDPGVAAFGLVNAVMPVGDTFLEVVSPVKADATAQRWINRRGGDAGYMAIFQYEDHAQLAREEARALGTGLVKVWEGEHEGARGVHLHPRELGAILSLDAMPAWDEWVWAGPKWRDHVKTEVATAITGLEMASDDPARLAARWGDALGTAPAADAEGRPEITLEHGGHLVFVPGEGGGKGGDVLVGMEVALADRAAFASRAKERGVLGADGAATIGGVRFFPGD